MLLAVTLSMQFHHICRRCVVFFVVGFFFAPFELLAYHNEAIFAKHTYSYTQTAKYRLKAWQEVIHNIALFSVCLRSRLAFIGSVFFHTRYFAPLVVSLNDSHRTRRTSFYSPSLCNNSYPVVFILFFDWCNHIVCKTE